MRIEPSSSPTESKSPGINIKYVAVGLIGLPKAATLCSFYATQYHLMIEIQRQDLKAYNSIMLITSKLFKSKTAIFAPEVEKR